MGKHYGGEGMATRPMGKQSGGDGAATRAMGVADTAAPPAVPPAADAPAQAGGRRRRGSKRRGTKRRSSKRRGSKRRSSKKGGDGGIVSTAAVPFGLLALQRYFKSGKTSKFGSKKSRRSFRRRH